MSDLTLPSLAWSASQQSNLGATASTAVPAPRLVSAAHEFEAAMMKELMAPLEQGHELGGNDDDEGGSTSALGSFAGEALGKAISEHGGFGVAKSILHQLSTGSNHSGKPAVLSNPNGTTTNSLFK
jgi:Rod binding domain-containing protein